MQLEEYLKIHDKEIQIENNLIDIETYTKSALEYLTSTNEEQYNLKELVMYLSCIPEILEDLRNLINQ